MKSILSLTSTLVLLSVVAQGSPAKGTLPVKKNVVFEVILAEGITSKPFLLVCENGINYPDLSNRDKIVIHPRSSTGNSYIFELKDQTKPLYFSLLLTGYLMDITVAREFHFEPGDRIKITVNKTDVPNIYDLDFAGLGSAKYRCQNEFLYAMETDTVETLPDFDGNVHYNRDNHTLRYTDLLYDLIEKYQPEMSDYSYHLLNAGVLGNLGKYLFTNLQVKLNDHLLNKDTAGFKRLSHEFTSKYKFDFASNIPDSVLSDSKEYALFMIEKIKTEVLMDFATVNYPIVYERIKKVNHVVLRDKMILMLFTFYRTSLHDDDGKMLVDALSVVKNKQYLEILKNI